MRPTSVPTRANADVIDAAYRAWLDKPDAVDPTWRAFFEGFTLGNGNGGGPTGRVNGETEAGRREARPDKHCQVRNLIQAYRLLGHLQAHLDPLHPPPEAVPELDPARFGLGESDMDGRFDVGDCLEGGEMSLRDLIAGLKETYCRTVGAEYSHIQHTEMREWLRERMEKSRNRPAFTKAQRLRILRRLHKAELFEKFLHTKYVGQKRFSLEGGEAFIAALDAVVEASPGAGITEIVMGMAHRGRLNVLTSVMRKPFELIFERFSENFLPDTVAGDGDVKYHLGYEAELPTSTGGKVTFMLAANPSHLEVVNPVVEGQARARQRLRGDDERRMILPLIVHGDAAIAGQGVVAETLNFSQLPGYRTGGTLHIVINNQIGFTTLPHEARSTRYCTDVAKMIDAPVFHVNGDDPEAVCLVTLLALDFRQKFQRDVMVDIYGYRKHGHNEGDEPAFTQPTLYRTIAAHASPSVIYTNSLIEAGAITADQGEAIKSEYTAALEANLARAKAQEESRTDPLIPFKGSTASFQPAYRHVTVETAVAREVLDKCVEALGRVPEHFKLNPKIRRLLDGRAQAWKSDGAIDWGLGESLAYGSLLLEGTPVRLSGQDSERGTFSHRHAVLYDIDTREGFIPLRSLAPDQARFSIYNSLLSEVAVMAFEYGYSIDHPKALVLWEAQFGDFANGAQVVIDQFLASGESKWQRQSGLVLLLPHGYEGQGPEHSSARLERFLQLCARNNLQVAYPTTPANFFHLLRRQKRRDFQKPLVIMTPKSLLRNPAAVSAPADFTGGKFEELIGDELVTKPIERVILCSGKVAYDLAEHRAGLTSGGDTAIVRIEQLYPLHANRLSALSDRCGHDARIVWCQEEPENMGAWRWIAPQLEQIFGRKPAYAGREASASPAAGILAVHKRELSAFIQAAFHV